MIKAMNVLIIEDEDAAVSRLKKELRAITHIEFHIIDVLESIQKSVSWLKEGHEVDLIFMDIHLTDGLSFEIFKQVAVSTPVIFTTAYDEYALKAFKVNSVDYLLKPIDPSELEVALNKYFENARLGSDNTHFNQIENLAKQFLPTKFRSSFLVSYRHKMMMIGVEEVAYIYVKERGVFIKKKDNQEYLIDFFLDDLEKQLDPDQFYRANRQFLISRSAIKEIEPYFNGRLILFASPEAHTSITISKEKATHFKRWADY